MIRDLAPELKVISNSVIVAGDFHIPFQNDEMIDNMLEAAEELSIDTFICAGDYLDCFNLSPFIKKDYLESTFQDELDEASKVMKKIMKVFKDIYFIEGNHERFWLKQLEGIGGIKDLFKLFTAGLAIEGKDYFVTEYDHLILNDDWYICHPQTYSRVPLSVPRRLSSKLQMSVCCAHLHRLSISKDESSKYYAVESGGLFDVNKLSYLKNSTLYPGQVNGYVFIKKNIPYLKFI